LENSPLGRRQLLDLGPVNRLEECVARRKVTIQSSRSNPCLLGDIVQADVRAGTSEGLFRDLKNALTIALRIGAQSSRDGLGTFCRHIKILQPESISDYLLITETLSVLLVQRQLVNRKLRKSLEMFLNRRKEWRRYLVQPQRRKMCCLA
jgi:hypothetical protein